MKICVLQHSYRDGGCPVKAHDPPRDLRPFLGGHDLEHVFLDQGTCLVQLGELEADVFVNLCDGAEGDDTPGIDVVRELERRGEAFTGAGSAFYDPTRKEMKDACAAGGVRTPRHVFADDLRAVDAAVSGLELPCFVKPRHGFSSVGITLDSLVRTDAARGVQVARVISGFGGALVEEYVEGREFSVLVASDPAGGAEPIVYPPIEFLFAPGVPFRTFDCKWGSSKNRRIACGDAGLSRELEAMTRAVFLELGGVGYARGDIRRDAAGRLFFLDINPNCAAFHPSHEGCTVDTILALAGESRTEFLAGLIQFALRRQRVVQSASMGRPLPAVQGA